MKGSNPDVGISLKERNYRFGRFRSTAGGPVDECQLPGMVHRF
jgi:hypothetical protein